MKTGYKSSEQAAYWRHPAAIMAIRAVLTGLLLGTALLGGCGPYVPEGGPSEQMVVGDWDDIEAAVKAGLANGECAVLGPPTDEAQRRVFTLRCITDAIGTLTFTREHNPKTDMNGSIPITVQARIGEPRDIVREGRLVAAVRRRLLQLAGVEFAPGD